MLVVGETEVEEEDDAVDSAELDEMGEFLVSISLNSLY